MRINIKIYDKNKYYEGAKVIASVDLDNVESYQVKEISANEILREVVGSCIDEYNKYLIITFDNGETNRLRHCHADVFRVD